MLEHADAMSVDHPSALVHELDATYIKAFGRAAQATWFLDQVQKSFEVQALDSRLDQLRSIDSDLQQFLSMIMLQCHSKTHTFCEAMTISIR
jgi:hypothetical protein